MRERVPDLETSDLKSICREEWSSVPGSKCTSRQAWGVPGESTDMWMVA